MSTHLNISQIKSFWSSLHISTHQSNSCACFPYSLTNSCQTWASPISFSMSLMFTLRELMFIYSCCVNIFISLFSFLCCNCQQAMEDLMEDEDEDFDKDDKVIMSCVRDALTHKHIHKRMRSHTHTHTLPQEVLTPLHTPETQTDERNDSIFPSHLHPCSVILSAWGTNTCTKIVQPFNLLKSFLCRYAHGTFLVFLPSSSASPWSFSAVCYTSAYFSLHTKHNIGFTLPTLCFSPASWEHAPI